MESKKTTKKTIHTNDIIQAAYEFALDCYGVVGVANKGLNNKITIANKDNAKKGIVVRKISDTNFSIDIALVLSSNVKISESIRETQKTVRYLLNKKFNNTCKTVNVYALAVN